VVENIGGLLSLTSTALVVLNTDLHVKGSLGVLRRVRRVHSPVVIDMERRVEVPATRL